MSRPLSRAFAVLVLAGSAATARAAGERIALRWDGPESCPADGFSAKVERYLGPRVGDGPPLSVRVRVREHGPGRWSLDLDAATSATTGTRHLEGESCETVLDAAAFVAAQAIGAASGDAPGSGASEPPPTADAGPKSALVPEPGGAESPMPSPAGDEGPAPPGSLAGAPAPPGSLTGADAPPGSSDAADPPPPDSPPGDDRPAPAPAGGIAPAARRPPPLRAAIRLTAGISGVALPAVSSELGLTVALLGARWRAEVVGHGRLPARVRSRTTRRSAPTSRCGPWGSAAAPSRASLARPRRCGPSSSRCAPAPRSDRSSAGASAWRRPDGRAWCGWRSRPRRACCGCPARGSPWGCRSSWRRRCSATSS
ncbi:hypothetical protein [Nannocystis pusilla]|uniref:hypothetical protein n=1 Tax=Nannocystis pusilla TaxID=889268 RepID=UPI003B789365